MIIDEKNIELYCDVKKGINIYDKNGKILAGVFWIDTDRKICKKYFIERIDKYKQVYTTNPKNKLLSKIVEYSRIEGLKDM